MLKVLGGEGTGAGGTALGASAGVALPDWPLADFEFAPLFVIGFLASTLADLELGTDCFGFAGGFALSPLSAAAAISAEGLAALAAAPSASRPTAKPVMRRMRICKGKRGFPVLDRFSHPFSRDKIEEEITATVGRQRGKMAAVSA
ncbi:MAG TPA: hypothetical protein VH684_10405 [Xanthobacteraceae bacterium]|jgi:hypothetical protein